MREKEAKRGIKKAAAAVIASAVLFTGAAPAGAESAEYVQVWGRTEAETEPEAGGRTVTYLFGREEVILPETEFEKWLFENTDGTLSADREEVRKYVENLAEEYDTAWVDRTFISDEGEISIIPAGSNTYGYFIDIEAETDALIDDLTDETKGDVKREPVYSQTGHGRNGKDDLCGTYIEVDIEEQEVTFYKDGVLIDRTACVTGNESAGTPSDTGTFCVYSKQQNAVLRGQNTDGTRYERPVSYWMPYNGGEGFHDASWRWEFGGDIYKWGGSHGCVNLKPEDAKVIYENTDMWTPVIVHK